MSTTPSNNHLTDIVAIDADAIEKQLALMRQRVHEESKIADYIEKSDTRACVLNLIVYVDASDECDSTYQMVEEAQLQNPGRFFFLVVNRNAEFPRLKADVDIKCRRVESGRTAICGEQITLHVDGEAVYSSPSAIAPLLMPDVPVYLLWPNPPNTADRLWSQLTAMVDRVIVDSRMFDKPANDLQYLSRLISNNAKPLKVTDLNWSGLTAWRGLIASFWDVPSYRASLDQISEIVIAYQPQSPDSTEIVVRPVLLVGWIASRLGWQVGKAVYSNATLDAILNANDREISLKVQPIEHGPHCAGLVVSVRLSQGTSVYEVRLSHDSQRLNTEVRIGDSVAIGRTLAYEIPDSAQRIKTELAMLSRDAVFESSLISAARLFEDGENT